MALPRHRTAFVIFPGLSLHAISLYEVDHIVPLSKGGRDDPSSRQWLPRKQRRDTTQQDLDHRDSKDMEEGAGPGCHFGTPGRKPSTRRGAGAAHWALGGSEAGS